MASAEAEAETGVRRWLVDITRWHLSPVQFDAAVALLPPHEAPAIARFVKEDDRKRALLSRLLQYALVHQVLGVPRHRIAIRRTDEGKPYLLRELGGGSCSAHAQDDAAAAAVFPNFNFSASHQGGYVGVASEPRRLVGLDIVAVAAPRGETVADFLCHFAPCLTDHEWSCARAGGGPDQVLAEFYRYWCLKEAYVKAVGAGIGFGLHRLEFRHAGHWTRISVRVDGQERRRWAFRIFELDETHLAAVARGPPEDAVGSYKETLPDLIIEEEQFPHDAQEIAEEGFVLLTVEQLTTWLQDPQHPLNEDN